jgi:hypothetical protein
MTVLDQTNDRNYRELYHFSKLYALPTYVKEADAVALHSKEYYDSFPAAGFGDVTHRQFPMATKAACWLSWCHFLEKRGELATKQANWIEQRLRQAAEQHGILQDFADVQTKRAAAHQDGLGHLPDSAFALVTIDDQGHKEREHPLRSAAEVKQAAAWFLTYRDDRPFRDRQTIANRLLEKAAQHGASLDPDTSDALERQAGRGVCNPKEAAAMLRDRARAAVRNVDGTIREALCKLADSFEKNAHLAADPATVAALCETVDTFDRQTLLAGRYSEDLPRPEDILFKGSLKLAAEFLKNAAVLTNGSVYDSDQFRALSLSNVRDVFGADMAEAVSDGFEVSPAKMATLAATLPRGDADLLERLMTGVGQQPACKQASVSQASTTANLAVLRRIHAAVS